MFSCKLLDHYLLSACMPHATDTFVFVKWTVWSLLSDWRVGCGCSFTTFILVSSVLGTWVPGYLGTWVPGYLGTWVPGYLGTWVPGYLGTWVPGYLGTWVWRVQSPSSVQSKN